MSTIEELQKLSEREDHVEFKKAEHNYPFAGGQKTDPRDRRSQEVRRQILATEDIVY